MINIIIDEQKVCIEEGLTILQACKQVGITIPTLCYIKNISKNGACRMCLVQLSGKNNLVLACDTVVQEGMEISTNSEKVLQNRKMNLKLLISNHSFDCLSCDKNTKCKLQEMCASFGIETDEIKGEKNSYKIDDSSCSIVRDNTKCILCGKCIEVCDKVQCVSAFCKSNRGFNTQVNCAFDKAIRDSSCVGCGQCTLVCPTAALMEKDQVEDVLKILHDKENLTVAMIAPSVRVALSEEFGNPIGTFDEKKTVQSLKFCGFDKVFDINCGADFTVIEEAKEFMERLSTGKNLPHFTSCCPAWTEFLSKNYNEYLNNLSNCKSPNEMLGSIVREYFKKIGEKRPIKIVSIMPCTAKKREIEKHKIIDVVLTTREAAKLIKRCNVNFNELSGCDFDEPFNNYSGAGVIFGTRSGVTEAVLRTILQKDGIRDNGEQISKMRSQDGTIEYVISCKGRKIKGAVVNGLSNAVQILDDIKAKKVNYDIIEFMACPGGCINGGGQPLVDYDKIDLSFVIENRRKSLYKIDNDKLIKQSDKNVVIGKIYKQLFEDDEKKIKKHLHTKF